MAGLLVVLVLGVTATWLIVGQISRLDEGHTIRGLFGERALDQLIGAWADRVVDAAERFERLRRFQAALSSRAWNGTLLHIDRERGDWCAWRFANGEVWEVRHGQRPRRDLPRVVVRDAVATASDRLAVRTYVPGGNDVDLPVSDARLVLR